MKRRIPGIVMGALIVTLALQSCEKEVIENETMISSHDSSESHHAGENCMNCHKSGGSGEGWFTVAGTVYDQSRTSIHPNTTVKLYTGPDASGTLMATIEVDQLGNFYSTESIAFGTGLFTLVEGVLATNYMGSGISTGACNSCHGATTGRIWAN